VGLTLEIGHLIGFAGAFLFSLSSVLIRRLGTDNSGLEPIFHYSLHAALWVIPLSRLFGSDLGFDTFRALWAGLALGVLGTSAQLMCYAALRWLPAYRVGVIGTLEVLGASAASWLLFNDPMSPRALFGGALIVLVVLMLNRTPAADTRQVAGS
jgi:drug/metabolite transporter (DMT)-like permease